MGQEQAFERRRRLMKKALAGRLKKARGSRSVEEVARKTGLPEATIYRYESGSMLAGADVLPLFSKAYEVSADWLLMGRGPGPA